MIFRRNFETVSRQKKVDRFKPLTCMAVRMGRLGRSRRPSSFRIIALIVRIVPIAGKIFETIGAIQ